jgi:hypothetical protein
MTQCICANEWSRLKPLDEHKECQGQYHSLVYFEQPLINLICRLSTIVTAFAADSQVGLVLFG